MMVYGSIGSRDSNLIKRIESELFALKETVDNAPDSLRQEPYYQFYVGAIYGYVGMYYSGIKGENLKAIGVGKDGINYHKKVLQADPLCYDAYYSVGLFHYFASMAPWYIKPLLWVFGMLGSDEQAHEYLSLAADKGILARYEAMEWLAQLYLRRKMIDSAAAVYRKPIREFPEGCYYYYIKLGNAYDNSKRSSEMVNVCQEAIGRSRKNSPDGVNAYLLMGIYNMLGSYKSRINRYDEAIAVYKDALTRNMCYHDWWYYNLGLSYEKLGDNGSALQYYKMVKGNELPREWNEKVQARLNELQK